MPKTPALRALTNALGVAPPVAAWSTYHATCVTSRWTHGPVHAYMPPMSGNVVAMVFEAQCAISWRRGNYVFHANARPGSLTIIPEGDEGQWDVAQSIDGMQLVISNDHLKALTSVIAPSPRIRLQLDVGSMDLTLFQLAKMLEVQLSTGEAVNQYLVDQSLNLFCLQLLASRGRGDTDTWTPDAPGNR